MKTTTALIHHIIQIIHRVESQEMLINNQDWVHKIRKILIKILILEVVHIMIQVKGNQLRRDLLQ